jgi:hypothetical protein
MATARTARTTKKRATTKRSTRSAKTVEAKGMTTPSHDDIALKAYEIWIANDRPVGRDLDNWYEAEAQLVLGI